MNANSHSPQESLIARVLTRSAALIELVQTGLPAMLKHSGCTPEFRASVQEFLNPAVNLIADAESDLIRFVRDEQQAMALAAAVLDRRAATPAQWKLAAQFRAFVEDMGRQPEKSKETRAKAFEMER